MPLKKRRGIDRDAVPENGGERIFGFLGRALRDMGDAMIKSELD